MWSLVVSGACLGGAMSESWTAPITPVSPGGVVSTLLLRLVVHDCQSAAPWRRHHCRLRRFQLDKNPPMHTPSCVLNSGPITHRQSLPVDLTSLLRKDDGNTLPGVAEALGTENEVNIAKIAWLSRKEMGICGCVCCRNEARLLISPLSRILRFLILVHSHPFWQLASR
jgi:hypothetical protein